MESASDSPLNIRGLILWPAVITLGITLLRLGGELAHWSPLFFNAQAGGGSAIVGISWLPFILGPYFAVKLTQSGHGTSAIWKTCGLAVVGFVLMVVGMSLMFAPKIHFPGKLVVGLLLIVLGPTLVTITWPALFKTLVVYGYAARIPVAIVMFFALRGHWGTHYDALPPNMHLPASFLGTYLEIAALPQMVMWIAFTVLVGTILGTIVAGLALRGRAASPAQ